MNDEKTARPHKCPVGTIRDWQIGQVIKLHDGSDFSSGWYPLIEFKALTNLAFKLDLLAQKFTKIKDPVDGGKFLDNVITNFQRYEGDDHGPFTPTDFKQYKGFYGALEYSFKNEFYKRANKIREEMYGRINDILLKKSGGSKNGITADEMKAIRDTVKEEYKARLDRAVDTSQFEQLGHVIEKSYETLKKATELDEGTKKVVDEVAKTCTSITREKQGNDYFSVINDVSTAKQECLKSFGHNWLLLETQFDKVDSAFNTYLSKNRGDINHTLQQFSIKQFGLDITGPIDDFYSQLQNKVIENHEAIKTIADPEDIFKGEHTVQLSDGTKGTINIMIEENERSKLPVITIAGDDKFLKKFKIEHLYLFKYMEDGKMVYEYQWDMSDLRGMIKKGFKDSTPYENMIGALMASIGELATPDDSNCENYKKLWLSGKRFTTYFKGVEVKAQIGFHSFQDTGEERLSYTKPVLCLANIKDAAKFKDTVVNGLQERGFSIDAADVEWKQYVAQNKFPLERYDLKALIADQTFRGTFIKSKIDFKPMLDMRFNAKYNKQLLGDWNVSNIASLKQIEHTIDELPTGHVINNKVFIDLVRDSQYTKAFAFYDEKAKRIQFSDDCLRYTSRNAQMDGSNYFKCVVVHEIGHAVTAKLGRYNDQGYRKFANECGWSYKDERTKDDATGDDIRVPREGANSHQQLITDYANVSPEEAFAEYYSFYHNNKKEIDEFLEIGETKSLKKYSITNPDLTKKLKYQMDSQPLIAHFGLTNQYALVNTWRPQVDAAIEDFTGSHFSTDLDVSIEPVDPWKVEFEKSINKELTKTHIASGRGNEVCTPALLIKNNNGTYTSIMSKQFENSNILEASRYLQRNTPAICLSERAYDKLCETHSDDLISYMMLELVKNEPVPTAEPIAKQNEKLEGLYYSNKVIDWKTIKANEKIIRQIRNVYNSESIQKAMEEAFGVDDVKKNNLFKSLSGLIPSAIESFKSVFQTKKRKCNYADMIVVTDDLKILFLHRNHNAKFMPDKLCLPGGGIDADDESAKTAAIRECREECNYNIPEDEVDFVTTMKNSDGSKTYYFIHHCGSEFDLRNHLVLQSTEQTNISFFSIDHLLNSFEGNEDLFILDLLSRLKKMIDENEILAPIEIKQLPEQLTPIDNLFEAISKPATPWEALGYLEKHKNQGNISEDDYIDKLFEYKEFVV